MMRHSLSIFGTFIVLFSFQISFAQTPTWTNITPPGWSGTFQSVDWFAGNGLLAIGNNGYFYQSLDTGRTWSAYPKPVESVSHITVYPDHKRAYICGGSHLYQTTDAAVSWQEITYTGMPSNISIFQIYIKTEDTLLASASDGVNGAKIYLSTNKGKTWSLTGTNLEGDNPLGSSVEEFYFVNSSHGYALGDGFYAETINYGYSWTLNVTDVNIYYYSVLEIQGHSTIITTNTSSPPPFDNALFHTGGINKIVQEGTMLYGVYGENFFSSVDSGKTWKVKTVDVNKQFVSITFFDQQNGVIVGNELTTYRTTDGGVTWTKSVYGGAEGFNTIYCKTKNECFITGNTGRLFHTANGGTSWDYQDLFKTSLQQVVFPTPDTGYVSASGAIFRTTDTTANGRRIWIRFAQPDNGGFLSFPEKDTGYIGYSSGWIDKTLDAGQTWNVVVDNTYLDNKSSQGGACFRSTLEGLVGGDNSLLYTNDGGNSWQVKANGIVASAIVAVKDNWLVMNTGNVYLCDKNINCKLKCTDISYNLTLPLKRDSNTILIPTNNDSILISKDCGNSWIKEYFPSMGELSFGDRNTIYALTNNIYKGVFKSQTTSSKFTQTDSQTLSCTITNDADSNYPASILLISSLQDTIIIN